MIRARPSLLAVLILAALGSGCTVRPQVVTEEGVATRIRNDLKLMGDGYEAPTIPITLEEATARALRYNLDYRLKLMEEALYLKNLDVSRADMLPKLLASAGYTARSNEDESASIGRDRATAGIEFSWDILDFGISYFRAKQQADQYLIAQERRRKVIQNVVQDVRSAYYRALAAQKLAGRSDELLAEVDAALKKSAQVEQRGLATPVAALQYQRALLETTSLLVQKKRELQLSRIELAALMNLPPGLDFEIADAPLPPPHAPPRDIRQMELTALRLRPELREEDYKARISEAEAKRLILGVLPGAELRAAFQVDSNTFLDHKTWFETGARASWNLFRLLALPSTLEMSEHEGKVNEVRRAALTMAVITQTRIAAQRYDMALADYDLAVKTSDVDDKLFKHSQSGSKAGFENELEVVRSRTKALFSEIQRYSAYSNTQAAYARLLNSLGVDLVQPEKDPKDVAETAAYLRDSLTAWDKLVAEFTAVRADPQAVPR